MGMSTDVRVTAVTLYFLPIRSRLLLKFGRAISAPGKAAEASVQPICVRVRLRVENAQGRSAEGWGETPLGVQWAWPADSPLVERQATLEALCRELAAAWSTFPVRGHPIDIGYAFQATELPRLLTSMAERQPDCEPIPWLAALVCCSPFDLALHDAYGILHDRPVYDTYNARFMHADLASYLTPADGANVSFAGRYPEDYLVRPAPGS